jgi:hypothetical protein
MEILILLVVVVVVGGIAAFLQQQKLAEAKARYEAALAGLTSHPGDNNYRIAALEAGRQYADLARKAAGNKGRAIFDEVALSNDLSARSGLATATSSENKKCPQCAELVKSDARVCRFCQHRFDVAA